MSLQVFTEVEVPAQTVLFFRERAKQKIQAEKWNERDQDLKAFNFVKSWISEFAWKTLLEARKARYKWADTYVGNVEDAPLDFRMWFGGVERTVGIRSRELKDLQRWLEVPYPDDRVRMEETNRIEDFTIIASISFENDGAAKVRLYGAVEKDPFIQVLKQTYRKMSPAQQEYFRPVALRHFNYNLMLKLLKEADTK